MNVPRYFGQSHSILYDKDASLLVTDWDMVVDWVRSQPDGSYYTNAEMRTQKKKEEGEAPDRTGGK